MNKDKEILRLERKLAKVEKQRDEIKQEFDSLLMDLIEKDRLFKSKKIYPFIQKMTKKYDVEKCCKALSVARSGYYKWKSTSV